MNIPEKTDILSFEKHVYQFSYTKQDLFFINDRSKAQEFSMLFPNSHFVVEWSRHEEEYDIQTVFPLTSNWDYNHYLILLYVWSTQSLYIVGYRSHTVYPPVWDRSFSLGPDYTDYVETQKYINRFIKSKNLKEFEVDTSHAGKVVNTTKETPDEIKKLLAEKKSYSIISVFAEAFYKNAELVSLTKLT